MALVRPNRALFPTIRKIQVRNFVAAANGFDRKKQLTDLRNSLRNDEIKFDAGFLLTGASDKKLKTIRTLNRRNTRVLLDKIHYHNILDANVLPDYDLLDLAAGNGGLSQHILSSDPSINLVACESSLKRRMQYSEKIPTVQVVNGSPTKIPLRSGM
jgi:hypothetical protein